MKRVIVSLTLYEAKALYAAGSNYTASRRQFTQARAARKLQIAMISFASSSSSRGGNMNYARSNGRGARRKPERGDRQGYDINCIEG